MEVQHRDRRSGITLLEVLVVIVVIGILMAMLLPSMGHGRHPRIITCKSNLSQLWKMENVYMATRGGRMKLFPTETGGAFWLKLNTGSPPLIEDQYLDIFRCPVTGNPMTKGETDFLGPASDVNAMKDDAWIGGDRIGNHGEDEGNMLRRSSDVLELAGTEYVTAAKGCTR